MAKSLQDQLLKSGLVDEKKSKKIKQQKRKQSKLIKQGLVEQDDISERARLQRQQEAERHRELNKERQQEAESRALQAQVKQLIEHHQIARPEDGEKYQFADDKKIKQITVSPLQRDQLIRGLLAIVRKEGKVGKEGRYEVVPAKTASKIQERWPQAIVLMNAPDEQQVDEDDPYADYQIPDDLMW